MSGPCLEELRCVIGELAELHNTLGTRMAPLPREADESQRILEKTGADPEQFGPGPKIQIKSRLEVRTGRLLANLCRETECIVVMLREHARPLGRLGVDEAFLRAVDELIGKLKDAQAKLGSTRETLSPAFAEQCSQKGKLYDLTRKLVWIGRLEFLCEPDQATAFTSPAPNRTSGPAERSGPRSFTPFPLNNL